MFEVSYAAKIGFRVAIDYALELGVDATAESAQFDLGLRGVPEVMRASVHYFNTDEEIDRLIDALDTLGARKSRPRNAVRASPTLAE